MREKEHIQIKVVTQLESGTCLEILLNLHFDHNVYVDITSSLYLLVKFILTYFSSIS